MRAAVLHEVGQQLVIEDILIDKPQSREVLVKTAAAGVCHSDLHFVEGLYPYRLPVVLGHESAGVVEAVGSDVTYVMGGKLEDPVSRCHGYARTRKPCISLRTYHLSQNKCLSMSTLW